MTTLPLTPLSAMSLPTPPAVPGPPVQLAVERPEINVPGYTVATVLTLLIVVALYWLMRRAWLRRGAQQSGLPPLPDAPTETGAPRMAASGRYHGSTAAGQWLERIVAHGLGTRSRAELTLTDAGLSVVRPGDQDFFVPGGQLRGARLDKAIAGKVLTEGGLLVVTWEHGGRLIDSGFRFDHADDHPAWVDALTAGATEPAAPTQESTP